MKFLKALFLFFLILSTLKSYAYDTNNDFHKARYAALNGDLKNSLSYFQAHQNFPFSDWYKAIVLEANGDSREAIVLYDKLIKEYKFVPAMMMRADIFSRYGQIQEAIDLLEEVKTIDPASIFLYKKLSRLYSLKKNYKKAYPLIVKYKSLNPKDKFAHTEVKRLKDILGEEYFDKQKKTARKARKELTTSVTRFAKGDIPQVRVAVANDVERFELKATSAFKVFSNSSKVFDGQANILYDICLWGDRFVIKKGENVVLKASLPVELRSNRSSGLWGIFDISHGAGDYWHGKVDSFFRGYLRLVKNNGALTVINVLNVEEYVYGVLPSEMFATWPVEALKAQAVLARTLALKRLGQFESKGYDFENSTRSQVYLGVLKERDRAIAAVDSTRGVVLTNNGKLSEIFFGSNSGGHTVNNGYGLASYRGVPEFKANYNFPLSENRLYDYLMPGFPSFSKATGKSISTYRWQRLFYVKQIAQLMTAAGYPCSKVYDFEVLKRNISGHVEKIKIKTDKATYTISNELKIRKALGNLRSSLFLVETIKNDNQVMAFLFWGGGFGHGIGMSQYGAKGMAEANYNWKQIIKHYFPKLALRKVYK